jgi:phosphoglycolate phosphatase
MFRETFPFLKRRTEKGGRRGRSSMKNISVVAFDCDGVLFDTEKANKAYYNQILNHFGMPDMDDEQFIYTHMHTADESIRYLFQGEEFLGAAQKYRKRMNYFQFIPFMEIAPFLKQVLQNLRSSYKTAIATNRSDTMQAVLETYGLVEHFDLVVSALEVERPKPHPDPLFKIIDHFQLKPENLIYVGDSKVDEQAARAAGVALVAYKNRSLTADFHIDSMQELEQILAGGNIELN